MMKSSILYRTPPSSSSSSCSWALMKPGNAFGRSGSLSLGYRPAECNGKMKLQAISLPPKILSHLANGYTRLNCQLDDEVTAIETKDAHQDVESPQSGAPTNKLIRRVSAIKTVLELAHIVTLSKIFFSKISPLVPSPVKFVLLLIQPIFEAWLAMMSKRKKIKDPTGSIDDIVGIATQKSDLLEIAKILATDGAKPELTSMVLLHGPLGTGKKALIYAIAKEAQVTILRASAKDLAKSIPVPYLFFDARFNTPCIILIDNMEDILKGQALDELLNQMEKLKQQQDARVLVIVTATGNIDSLYRVFTNSYMLIECMEFEKPNKDDRKKMFAKLMEGQLLEEHDAICDHVASNTEGYIWNQLKVVAIICKRLARDRTHVTMDEEKKALKRTKLSYQSDQIQDGGRSGTNPLNLKI